MPDKEKVVFSWSGGKDSAIALYQLQKCGRYEIVALLTTVAEEYGRVSHHGVREELLEIQAEAIGLPLDKLSLPSGPSGSCRFEEYEELMGRTMARYCQAGVLLVGHGDIFLEDLREYREKKLAKLGMKALFPLWRRDTTRLTQTFIKLGFKAYITCVDGEKLPAAFAGRPIDAELVRDLPEGVDPCGENGEFHSFVYDGPIFQWPLDIKVGEVVSRDTRYFADLLPAHLANTGSKSILKVCPDKKEGPPMADALDTKDMASILCRFPHQFREGLAAAGGVKVPGGPFGSVLVAGMGGSWMAAALVRDANLAGVPIQIHRRYQLPDPLHFEAPLVVASSFSGNTREVISTYEAAGQAGLPVVGIASGGELAERCEKDKVSFVRIPADPPDMQPRSATGYTVGILTRLLDNHGLASEGAVEAVEALAGPLEGFIQTARQRANRLVPELRQATPVIYTSQRYRTVARIFKIKINENAKTPAFWNVFPELNHNEMVGWTQRHGPFHLVVLRDPQEYPCVLKRMDLARELLAEHGVSSSVVPIEGGNLLEKIFSTLLVGDWASYELALALGVDPTPVEMVEDFKRQLRKLDETC